MDGSKLLMIGGLGVGGYLAYQWYQKNYGATVAAPAAAASAAAASSPTAAASVPASASAAAARPLDSIYQALAAAASAGGVNPATGVSSAGQNIDSNGWNWYLSSVYSLPGGAALPGGLFPGTDGQPMTLAAYWGVMAPWLASTQGLSGLGIFGGLGAIAARSRMRRAY
jgi:hypothetical protein